MKNGMSNKYDPKETRGKKKKKACPLHSGNVITDHLRGGWGEAVALPCAPTARDQKPPKERPTSAATPDELSHANAEALF